MTYVPFSFHSPIYGTDIGYSTFCPHPVAPQSMDRKLQRTGLSIDPQYSLLK
jgi:hypothetical protein